MRPLLALALVCCLGLTAMAQPAAESTKYIVVFTSPTWQSNPVESALVASVTNPPPGSPLEPWVRAGTVKHFKTNDPTYRERFAALCPPERLPAIIVQRNDGGYVYKATGNNVPTDAYTLGREIEYFAGLDPLTLRKNGTGYQMDDSAALYGAIRWQSGDEWCPDGTCPNLPPSREPLPDQSRGPLVRVGPDSVDLQPSFDFSGLAPAVWIVGGLVALLVFAFVAFVTIVLLFVVVRMFKTSR